TAERRDFRRFERALGNPGQGRTARRVRGQENDDLRPVARAGRHGRAVRSGHQSGLVGRRHGFEQVDRAHRAERRFPFPPRRGTVKRMYMKQLNRRQILRGAGVALALPWLESLAPRSARAQAMSGKRRYVMLYFPNGTAEFWRPSATGSGDAWKLSP